MHTCLPLPFCLQVRAEFGALHGQHLRAHLRLSCDDAGYLDPQLGGEWDIELICNDTQEMMWQLCRPRRPLRCMGASFWESRRE